MCDKSLSTFLPGECASLWGSVEAPGRGIEAVAKRSQIILRNLLLIFNRFNLLYQIVAFFDGKVV